VSRQALELSVAHTATNIAVVQHVRLMKLMQVRIRPRTCVNLMGADDSKRDLGLIASIPLSVDVLYVLLDLAYASNTCRAKG
jgi:hypothetical protein